MYQELTTIPFYCNNFKKCNSWPMIKSIVIVILIPIMRLMATSRSYQPPRAIAHRHIELMFGYMSTWALSGFWTGTGQFKWSTVKCKHQFDFLEAKSQFYIKSSSAVLSCWKLWTLYILGIFTKDLRYLLCLAK